MSSGIFNGIFNGIFIGILSFSGTVLAQNQLHFEETNPMSVAGQRAALGTLEGLQAQEQNQQPERKNKQYRSPANADTAPGSPLSFRATLQDMAARWPPMKVYDTKIIPRPGEKQPDMRTYLNAAAEKVFAAVGRINCFDPATGLENFSTATVVGNKKTLLKTRHFTMVDAPDGTLHLFHPSQCTFNLYNAQGRRYFSSKLSIAHSGTEDPRQTDREGELDWAVLTLENPVPSHVSPMSIQPMDKRELRAVDATVLVGYHGDVPAKTRKVISNHCYPEGGYTSTMIAHLCDTGGGSSGALIYKIVKGRPVAMAMNISESIHGNENQALLFGCRLQTGLRAEGVEIGENQACKVGSRGGDYSTVADGTEKIMEKAIEVCATLNVSAVTIETKTGGSITTTCKGS